MIINYIIGYYTFTFQQYIIHKIQHTKYFMTHKIQHHGTYDISDITKIVIKKSLYQSLDLYFFGNILCMSINIAIFNKNIIIFQLLIAYLSYYFHDEYHNPNSIWKNYSFYKYLKNKHQLHHLFPKKNHFLLDPIFDIIFNTYI